MRPQLGADDLELDRFHARAELERRCCSAVHTNTAEVIDQTLGSVVYELDTCDLGWLLDRESRFGWPEEFQAVGVRELGGHGRLVRIELRDEVLSHGEQGKDRAVRHRVSEFAKERLLLIPVRRIQGEYLLELVENHEEIQVGVCVEDVLEVVLEADRRELISGELLFNRSCALERCEDGEPVAIRLGYLDRCFVPHAYRRQDVESSALDLGS